jgi:putative hydrolase of the HAD superfamily
MKSIMFDLYGTLINIRTDEENDKFWKNLALNTMQYKKFNPVTLKKEYLTPALTSIFIKQEQSARFFCKFAKIIQNRDGRQQKHNNKRRTRQ